MENKPNCQKLLIIELIDDFVQLPNLAITNDQKEAFEALWETILETGNLIMAVQKITRVDCI